MTRTEIALPELFLDDETAWLDIMAARIKAGNVRELDFANLGEFLTDMVKRDRREVESRLIVLLTHILKWDFQPAYRSRSWQSSIIEHRQELASLADRGVLRNHAEAILSEAYRKAVERAAAETGLAATDFPGECEYTFDAALSFEPQSQE